MNDPTFSNADLCDVQIQSLIDQARQSFWSRHAHLSEQHRQQLWQQKTSASFNNGFAQALAPDVPRTMSYGPASITQLPSQTFPKSMDRIHSAPAAPPMKRSISSHSNSDGTNAAVMGQRSISTMTPSWQLSNDEAMSDYTYSKPVPDRPRSSLRPINEASTLTVSDVHEYSPAEYIHNCINTTAPSPSNFESSQLCTPQLTPTSQWGSSFDDSTSPSTPVTCDMTNASTISSRNMSRQSSIATQFMGDLSMMHVPSTSSNVPVLDEDCFPFSLPSDVNVKNISMTVDSSSFPNFTGIPSENFLSHVPVSSSADALAPSKTQSYLVEDMQRSTSNESNESDASVSSNGSRQSRREQEIRAQASRRIAPRAIPDNEETRSSPSNAQMVRIASQDGSSKDFGVINKTPYVRPQHPKIKCPLCNQNPLGFRGEHELRRHTERAHSAVRKVWICVDASKDKKFLANCKHCRNKKQYGAYYNAAAHLRRAHFNPRKRGRKGKHDEKRGGIGGGDKPPMDELKQFWIKEIEVENVSTVSNDAGSDSDDANCENDNTESLENDASYTFAEYSNPVVDMISANQGTLPMAAFNTSLESTPQLASYFEALQAGNDFDVNGFQFDAQPDVSIY